MRPDELFDIAPAHYAVAEISRRRIDYGANYAPVGYAVLWLAGRVHGAGLGDQELFGIYGVHGKNLLVRYDGGYRHGFQYGPGRAETHFWVHAGVFPDGVEILARYLQPIHRKYWHPNWRRFFSLPPLTQEDAVR